MKISVLTALFLVIAFTAIAQENPSDFKAALKIYNSVDYGSFQNGHSFNDSTGAFLRTTDTELTLLRPVFAVQWQNKAGHFHELELNRLELGLTSSETVQRNQQNNNTGPTVAGADLIRTRIALGYQYIIPLKKENEGKTALYLGLGGITYYQYVLTKPLITTEFPASAGNTGVRLFLSPRFNWFFSERLFLDVQAQIFLADMRFSFVNDQNPTIPIENQRQTSTEFATLPSMFSGRIGLGFKF